MKEKFKLNLQLFAGEGTGGEGGGEGAPSGDNATAAAEQKLRELGVPEDKIRKRVSKVASKMPTTTANAAPVEQKTEDTKAETTPPQDNPTEEKAEAPARMSWDEIMKDPEYNKQMQAVVQSRLKSAKGAEEALGKMAPALEVLARKYDLDPANMDYDALAKKINDDDSYYEDKALEMGVSVETAKKIDQMERNTEREKAQEQKLEAERQETLQEQTLRQHYDSLVRQGEALKKVFPNFNLQKELQNPVFARMTAPGKGIMSVEDAYKAVHHDELQIAGMQITAQKTAEKISNAIQSGSRRPDESGVSSQAPSVNTFDYRNASREQREALKQRIRQAAARGEKLYPGQ